MSHDPPRSALQYKRQRHPAALASWCGSLLHLAPLIGAMVAGLMVGGMVMFMHKDKIGPIDLGFGWPLVGLAGVLVVMFVWWRTVIYESSVEHAHSPVVKIGLRYGMALFIASEVMFFSAFFWAYYSAALYPPAILGGVWPPANIKTFDPFDMPFIMTLILLSCPARPSHGRIMLSLRTSRKIWSRALAITAALGFSFLTLPSLCRYHHAEFGIKSGIFGSTFFMATGFHGLHVIIGTIFLSVCLWRAKKGQVTPQSHFGLEAAAWYWHFVDVVWLSSCFISDLLVRLKSEMKALEFRLGGEGGGGREGGRGKRERGRGGKRERGIFTFRAAPTFITIFMLSVLLSLAIWQVERLHWKENLLATIKERMQEEPIDVDRYQNIVEADYRPAKASGLFQNNHEFYLNSISLAGLGGYHVLVPMRLEDGRFILIDRGWVALR